MSKQLTPKEELQALYGGVGVSLLCWWLSGKTEGTWHTVLYWGALLFALAAVSALFNYVKSCFRRGKEYDNRTKTREAGTRYNPKTGEVLNDGRAAYFGAWEDTLTPLWKGQFEATFSYVSSKQERTRRTVKVTSIEKDYKDALYFRGFCQLRNEVRTFALDRIKTMLTIDGKKYDLWEYVDGKIRPDGSQLAS